MAKQIARLLKTNIMADMDLPALAQLLSKKGRKGDTILAHINREEAQKLLEDGGSGTTNPDTGLPEFFGEDDLGLDFPVADSSGQEISPEQVAKNYPQYYPQGELPQAGEQTVFAPSEGGIAPYYQAGPTTSAGSPSPTGAPALYLNAFGPAEQMGAATPGQAVGTTQPTPEEKGLLASLTPQQKLQFAISGGLTGLSAILGRRGIQQSKEAARQTRDIGTPYREQGQAMVSAAQRGELTPVGQQQLQAARAQLAQGAERRGGVGAQQTAVQLAQFKQNLLDTQYKYGLQIAQIGDQYAQKAISQGLTGDAEMARLMQGLAGSIGSIMGAQPTRTP